MRSCFSIVLGTTLPSATDKIARLPHRASLFLALALILSGCGHFRQYSLPKTLDHASIEQLSHWTAEGKLGVKAPGESLSINLHWQQKGEDYDLLLFGPFGKGKTRIVREGRKVTLSQADQRHQARDAESLLYQLSGVRMPVRHLSYWVRGLPAPRARVKNTQFNEESRLSTFEQAGWKVEFLRFSDIGHLKLPGKIRLYNEDYRLTLIIKRWNLHSAKTDLQQSG